MRTVGFKGAFQRTMQLKSENKQKKRCGKRMYKNWHDEEIPMGDWYQLHTFIDLDVDS